MAFIRQGHGIPGFRDSKQLKELFMRSGRLAVVGVAALLLVASVAVADQPSSTDTRPGMLPR